jgi:hypothetical protein
VAQLYYYSHARSDDPDDLAVQGVVAQVLLEPWGGGVLPHEHTMRGPKEDRLGLLRATETQLSPILALDFDRSERYRYVMSRGWTDEWRARDGEGLLHQLVAIDADDDGALRVPLIPLARELLSMSGRAFGRAFAASAMSRAGRHRLLRNALAVLGNVPLAAVRDDALDLARAAARDHRPEVRAAAERLEERASRA